MPFVCRIHPEILPERIYQRLNAINTECLDSVGKVIKKIGELRPSDVHKLQQMYDYGADLYKISLKLAEVSGKNVQEIYDIFDIVAKDNYDYAKPFYEAKAIPFVPFEENEKLHSYVRALAKQTVDEYVNLTQHTAFAVFAKDGKSIAPLFAANKGKVATSLSDTYTKVIDYAVTQVQLGVKDYNSAMRSVVKSLADSGIRTVDYATGYSRRLDTAVRQNILWGIKECNQNVADLVGEEFGADGYEISYHSHPRPGHEKMGGRQYARGKARTVNGVEYPSFEEEAEPLLKEYGCLHFKFPILLGISRPAYSESQLTEFKAEDRKTFEFEGKKYTKYEASQLQRKIETEVRHQKDRAVTAKAAGDDDLRREAQYKINLLTSKYAKLSDASDLPTKMERMDVRGFRSVKAKTVDKSTKGGIIKSGAVSGARNPFGEKAEKHAVKYYGLVRSMTTDVSKIAATTGYSETKIQKVKKFIFMDKHDLGGPEPELFQPDYMMAESWRRLVSGSIEPHDLTLLRHELMEMGLMKKGYSQSEAHKLASKKYNYAKEAAEYYDKIEKYSD